jgi:hypothetical protein
MLGVSQSSDAVQNVLQNAAQQASAAQTSSQST